MTTLTLKTMPTPNNQLYIGRKILTKTARATKEALKWEIRSQARNAPISGDVGVHIKFFFKDRRSTRDNDSVKQLFDCMSGIVYDDDRQISEHFVQRFFDKENPRIEVTIYDPLESTGSTSTTHGYPEQSDEP